MISRTVGPVIATQAVDELQHLRLDGDIECRGRLVGDQQLRVVGKRRGNHDALALAAGETVRHVIVARRRVGDADLAHQRDGAARAPRRRSHRDAARRVSAIWSPTGHVGSRLAEASWKIIDDFVAAHAAATLVVQARRSRGR